MRARAASASAGPADPLTPRKPARITDGRFEARRARREARCDECGKVKGGNDAGAFWHSQNMPPTWERQAAWERGDWDATWYCTECYMRYYDLEDYAAVRNMLGFTGRAAKKARYGKGKP